jgi:glycerophosphoryl diester phosphodiesterase
MLYYIVIALLAVVMIYFLSWRPNWVDSIYKQKPLWFAHRGALLQHPENTLSSYKYAIAAGIPAIEMDVLSTKDGVVVCSHNFDLERKTDGFGYIHHMDFHDLHLRNTASNSNNTHERIYTLEEVFNALDNEILINVEIKTHRWFDIKTAYNTVKIINKTRKINRTIISSFNPLTLWAVKKFNKKIPTGWIFQNRELLPLIFIARPDFIHPRVDIITKDLLSYAKRKRVRINAWTINTKPAIVWLIDNGIDGIITDRLEFYKS